MGQSIQEYTKQNLWKATFKKSVVCLARPYHFKFFKGCLPQILLGPFLDILPHITLYSRLVLKYPECPK